jgi:hypothetical protein
MTELRPPSSGALDRSMAFLLLYPPFFEAPARACTRRLPANDGEAAAAPIAFCQGPGAFSFR